MNNGKLSNFESIWYMCKACKICLEKYEAMQEHIANNHDDEDFPDDAETILDTKTPAHLRESIPSTDVKSISTTDTQTNEQRERPRKNRRRGRKVSSQQDTDTNKGQRKQQGNLKNKKLSKFTCEKCLSIFSHKGNLDAHLKTHTGERPFACNLCPKSFAQVTNLNNHLRIHTGDRPFKCKYCSKCFTQVANLTFHERIHTGEKPYKCETCEKKFAQIANWSSHVRNHHKK